MADSGDGKKRGVDSRRSGFDPKREEIEKGSFQPEAAPGRRSVRDEQAVFGLQREFERNGVRGTRARREMAIKMSGTAEPDSLQRQPLREGDGVYAFASRPDRPHAGGVRESAFGKGPKSPYYMTQREYNEALAACRTKDGQLDRDQIKSRFALPCENRCDQVIRRRVQHTHEAWHSTCAPTRERVRALDERKREIGTYDRSMAGGGQQVFCMNRHLGPMHEHQHGLRLSEYHNDREVVQEACRQRAVAEKEAAAEKSKEKAPKDRADKSAEGPRRGSGSPRANPRDRSKEP